MKKLPSKVAHNRPNFFFQYCQLAQISISVTKKLLTAWLCIMTLVAGACEITIYSILRYSYLPELINRWWLIGESADIFWNVAKPQIAISLLYSYSYAKIAGFMDFIVVSVKWPNVGTLCCLVFEFSIVHPIVCIIVLMYNYGKGDRKWNLTKVWIL